LHKLFGSGTFTPELTGFVGTQEVRMRLRRSKPRVGTQLVRAICFAAPAAGHETV